MKNGFTKKILITGGSGYVGSRLVKPLVEKGYKVSVIDKALPKEPRNFKHVNFYHSNILNKSVLAKALSGQDLVVHLAANIGPLTYMHDYQADIMEENCAIDSVLYPQLVKSKIKTVVYSSSSMVFQESAVYPYKEEDINLITPPTNIYGMSKLVGEYFCKAFKEQYGLNYVILRYHNIYGPGEDSKGSTPGDIHVIPALVAKVLSGQYPLEIMGSTKATRPFTHIKDAVTATALVVDKALEGDSKVLNEDFNIGPEEATEVLSLASKIWDMLGDSRPFKYKIVKTPAVTAERREMDPNKVKNILEWTPKITLEEGIREVADWLSSEKYPSGNYNYLPIE